MSFLDYFKRNFLTVPRRRSLPKKVITAIHEREQANEILARVIQLAIVFIFLGIYSFSPKTGPADAIYPVPWVLGIYLVLSIVGFIWSIRGRLPDWSVYGSILFDFGMLYGLMVSFHFQYMQPASFILKAPALLYVFIFIALRVLRLESKFVIAAGTVAALGWLAMIFYVIEIDPGDNMLTRSYVEYLTSNTILIGAEIDKILSIVFVTVILALAVNGSANLLVTAVREQNAATALSRFFDSSVASDIRDHEGDLVAGMGDKVSAAILNVDIRGFTGLASKMDGADVMSALSEYQSRIVPIVQANGGIIDKFMGDGIMVTFGLGEGKSGPDQGARSALEAVEFVLADFHKWHDASPHLRIIHSAGIGMGLAGGEVAHGAVGDADRLEMTVIGSAVNLSAKLEKHNRVLGSRCVITASLYDEAIAQGYAGNLKPQRMETQIDGVDVAQEIVVISK